MTGFREVADRVWVARQEWFDLNVVLVGGSDGLLLVDTQASARAARVIAGEVTALGLGPLTAIFNTHEHFDHTFGNGAFREAFGEIPIHAHDEAAARTRDGGDYIKGLYAAASVEEEPRRDEVLETEIVPADHTFSSVRVLDLGDRHVELIHPGRGHSWGDSVVRVAGAAGDVLLAGDLVEEGAPPSYGPDCHPLEWPGSLDVVLNLIGPDALVVPGHGAVVDRAYVEEQRDAIAIVAQTIGDLAAAGVPADRALAEGEWPFPVEGLREAVARGYAALPPSGRGLPLA